MVAPLKSKRARRENLEMFHILLGCQDDRDQWDHQERQDFGGTADPKDDLVLKVLLGSMENLGFQGSQEILVHRVTPLEVSCPHRWLEDLMKSQLVNTP